MSMYYTKQLSLVFIIFLSGCSTNPTITPSSVGTGTHIKSTNNASSLAENPPVENLVTLYENALAELNYGDVKTAEKYFLDVTKTHPSLAGAWANLAVIYIKQKNYGKAEGYIQKALEKNPSMAQALNMAGFIEEKNGNINKAKVFYERAITEKPDYALAHYNLALLHDVYLQNIVEAVKHYQQYLILFDGEDKKTKNWVNELKRNIKNGGA